MKKEAILIVILLVAVAFAGCTGGEKTKATGKGVIFGAVKDIDRNPIEWATITLVEPYLTAETDENGGYRIEDIKPGTYTITAEKEGCITAERSVNIIADKELEVIFLLYTKGQEEQFGGGPKTLEVYLTNKVIKKPDPEGAGEPVEYELTTIKPSSEEKAPFGTGVGQGTVPAEALWSIKIGESMNIPNNTKFKFWLSYETVPQVPLAIWAHIYKNGEEEDYQSIPGLSPIMPGTYEYEVEFKTMGKTFAKDDALGLGLSFFGINAYQQPVVFAVVGPEHPSGAVFAYEVEEW